MMCHLQAIAWVDLKSQNIFSPLLLSLSLFFFNDVIFYFIYLFFGQAEQHEGF